jgi:hypothetical protein
VIVDGNERVIRPRLTDSEFFWEQDKSRTLASRIAKLDSVLFMEGLGLISSSNSYNLTDCLINPNKSSCDFDSIIIRNKPNAARLSA